MKGWYNNATCWTDAERSARLTLVWPMLDHLEEARESKCRWFSRDKSNLEMQDA
jgi:hypothetical protein